MPILGKRIDGEQLELNVNDMIGTHTCAIANTGAGKSGLLRVLAEQTHGAIQQIILDPDDEFYTLREKGDYLIAGGETGDCPATLANATQLARTLMEHSGISAVIQLSHLKPWEQQEFARLFLEELMHTPRALWHPFLLFIDETHRFAPQEGNVASSDAVHDISARGRKRGITAVFATQRMATINKNVTAGVTNWILGRVAQDADRRAAAAALGMSASANDAKEIAFLPKRRFWAFGPAIGERPVLFDVGKAETTMVKAGQAVVPTPPPAKALQKLLEGLSKAAAPVVAPKASDASPGAPVADLDAIRKEAHQEGVGVGYDAGLFQGQGHLLDQLEEWITARRQEMLGSEINVGVDDQDCPTIPELDLNNPQVAARVEALKPMIEREVEAHKHGGRPIPGPQRARVSDAVERLQQRGAAQNKNTAGAALLKALTQHHPMRLTWAQVASFCGRKARGGSFNTAKKWLIDQGLVIDRGDTVEATPAGLDMAPPPEQPEDKVEAWANTLPTPADLLLRHLVDHPGLTVLELADQTGRQPKGGSWNTAMRHLKANDLVEEVDGRLSASRWLFD